MTNKEKRIVTALRCCPDTHFQCDQCPVYDSEQSCQNELNAADLIESLSEQNCELLQKIKHLEKHLEQVTMERDAAVEALSDAACCADCKKCLEGKGDVVGCAWRVIDGELCPELSNLIRDLEEQKDPWIPIKAGTPKPYKNVRIYCANNGIDDVGYYSKYSGKWNLSNGRIACGVTHWKYLDNPPEVDKDES